MTTTSASQDVVDILTTDHHEVLQLIGAIKTEPDGAQKQEMADTVIAELMRHSIAEEMHVYPVIRKSLPNGENMVQHDTNEHQALEEAMKQLEGLDGTRPEFEPALERVEALLRDHASDEETSQFPQLRATLPPEELQKMGAKVEAAKKAAPTRPHPGAPHSALFHKTLGPGVGLVDRLRDKLTDRPNGA